MRIALHVANAKLQTSLRRAAQCLLAVGMALACPAGELYALSPAETRPTFDVVSLGFVHTHGIFNDASGTLIVDRPVHRATIEVVINTRSLVTGSERRDAFLKGKSFFDVDTWPSAIVMAENFDLSGSFPRTVDGTLIMVGVSQPVALTITSMSCDPPGANPRPSCRGHVVTTIQRSRWGLNRFTHLVSNNVKIAVDVAAMLTSDAGVD